MNKNRYNISQVAMSLDHLSANSVAAESIVRQLISESGVVPPGEPPAIFAQIAVLQEIIDGQKTIIMSLRRELETATSGEDSELSDEDVELFRQTIISSIAKGSNITALQMLYPKSVIMQYGRQFRAIIATELVNYCRTSGIEPDNVWLNLMLTNGGSS